MSKWASGLGLSTSQLILWLLTIYKWHFLHKMAYINVRILSIHGQITSLSCRGFSPARYVGRGPKKNMLGRYQYPLHKASELGNARPGAAKKHRSKHHRFGRGRSFRVGTRQVSNEGPGLLGKPYFSLKVQGNSSDLRDILMNNCVQINQKFGAICLVQEVDDKTIPSDTSGLRDTTNKYPPKIVFGRRFDCCSLLSRDPLFHPRIS